MDKQPKMLPTGVVDFKTLRESNCYYVDKSMYIEKLEKISPKLFLIRPRRFGKSIFLSMLRYYYDVTEQWRFDELFGGMYIHEHPTPHKGQYQVMYFDFSQASSGEGSLEQRFHEYCSQQLNIFAQNHKELYAADFCDEVKACGTNSASQLRYIASQASARDYKLYLIIDEYDNFTNNVLNEQGQEVYHALTHATGFYREIFKLYKANFQRILMMGVSPVTLDDLTSGYNISTNISTNENFNMMLGFSETDVRNMIEYFRSTGDIKVDTDTLIKDMKPWYDNYCFAKESLGRDPKMFNCDMVVYYLNHVISNNKAPDDMLDPNTKTDYKKMKKLIEIEGYGDEQRSIIKEIATEGMITGTPNSSFPAERIYEEDNFISLLYYYGMLTMIDYKKGKLWLGIPNNNVRRQYYDFLLEEYQNKKMLNMRHLSQMFWEMSYEGKWQKLLQFIADSYRDVSSVRDAIEGERNIQGYMLAYLTQCEYYLTAPEMELNHGYCDFFLMPDLVRFPDMEHSYIIELKYLGAKATEAEQMRQWDEAIVKIRGYAQGGRTKVMTQGTQLHLIVMQFREHEMVRMEEIALTESGEN